MRLPINICVLSITALCVISECHAQNVFKDYFSGPVQYTPSDPWTKGKVFNHQTGHSGLFKNCDDEECKRYSPYICWKPQYRSSAPLRRGLLRGMVIDVDAVKQRIRDGAGDCCGQKGCTCSKCRQHGTDCACQVCRLGENPEFSQSQLAAAPAQEPRSNLKSNQRVVSRQVETGKWNTVAPQQTAAPQSTTPRTEDLAALQRQSLTESVKKKYGLISTPTMNYDQTVKEIESRMVQQQKSDAETRVAEAIKKLQRRR